MEPEPRDPDADAFPEIPHGARVLVSACLLGLSTRYAGDSKPCQAVKDFLRTRDLIPIPVCPEQLGGLPTPRSPSSFVDVDGDGVLQQHGKLINSEGADTTSFFTHGAQQCLCIAQLCECKWAILKERSPSCGVQQVYTGETRIRGRGVSTALLIRAGVRVISEVELAALVP